MRSRYLTSLVLLSSIATPAVLATPQGAPSILFEPADQRAREGMRFVFAVQATGSEPLTFRWQHEMSPVNEGTNSTLLISSVQPSDAGMYRVVISSALGSITSRLARLTVQPSVPPGAVFGWGDHTYGALMCNGTTNVVDFGADSYHSVALLADGTTRGWGLPI